MIHRDGDTKERWLSLLARQSAGAGTSWAHQVFQKTFSKKHIQVYSTVNDFSRDCRLTFLELK